MNWMKCVVLIELIDCPCSQGRVLYTVINQVAGNTSGWDVWGLNFNSVVDDLVLHCHLMTGRREQRRKQNHVRQCNELVPHMLTEEIRMSI